MCEPNGGFYEKSNRLFYRIIDFGIIYRKCGGSLGAKKKSPPQQEEIPIVWQLGYKGKLSLTKPTEPEIPENFSAQSIRPLSKMSYEQLKKYGIFVCSYCSDSHKRLRSYYEISHRITGSCIDGYYRFFCEQKSYDFDRSLNGAFIFGPKDEASYYNDAEEILEEQVPGKSYIITFASHVAIDESQTKDLGIMTKEDALNSCYSNIQPKQKEILDKIKGKKVHIMQTTSVLKQLPGFPTVEKFDGESATKVFDFGNNEDVSVQIPKTCISSKKDEKNDIWRNECVTSIKLNKSQLPLPGVGNGDKVIFIKGAILELKTTNKVWTCRVPEKSPPLTSDHRLNDEDSDNFVPRILERGHYYEHFGDLGEGYYFLDIKIAKKENDYYRSTSGWKIYVPNSDYQEYFDSQLKKGMFQPSEDDRICYKIILLENNGKYELALKALPYKIEIGDF